MMFLRKLATKFNFISDIASVFISGIDPHVIHNLEKYYAIKKVFYLSKFDKIEGDYLEFGVFTGGSFTHAIRSFLKTKIYKNEKKMRFVGFDSFEGFGSIDDSEDHPFYQNVNFETDYEKVNARVRKVSREIDFQLVKGFFNETLNCSPEKYNIKKTAIMFIDSDTYSSAKDALNFASSTIDVGTYIILDDFFSYSGRTDRGVYAAFDEFIKDNNLSVRNLLNYGMGGSVFVVSGK